jgi:hypothetical protein
MASGSRSIKPYPPGIDLSIGNTNIGDGSRVVMGFINDMGGFSVNNMVATFYATDST